MKNKLYVIHVSLAAILLSSTLLLPAIMAAEDTCPDLFSGKVSVELTAYQSPYRFVKHQDWSTFYLEILLSGATDPDSIVQDGVHYAYCAQKEVEIVRTEVYEGYMICTFDTDNSKLPDHDWDKINYILNHKQGKYSDVQDALWYYTEPSYTGLSAVAQQMVNAAEANGEGYKPGEGEKLAVYIYIEPPGVPSNDVQDLIIEVDVPPTFNTPEVPFGTLALLMAMASAFLIRYRKIF